MKPEPFPGRVPNKTKLQSWTFISRFKKDDDVDPLTLKVVH